MMEWRNRVIEQRLLPVAELMANPANWRGTRRGSGRRWT